MSLFKNKSMTPILKEGNFLTLINVTSQSTKTYQLRQLKVVCEK